MTTGGDCGRCGKWFETQCYDDQGYGDCPECKEKLKAEKPTPQNREADMPDTMSLDWKAGFIEGNRQARADLANKPALDTGWVCPHCNVAYNPKKIRCECQDGLKARMG